MATTRGIKHPYSFIPLLELCYTILLYVHFHACFLNLHWSVQTQKVTFARIRVVSLLQITVRIANTVERVYIHHGVFFSLVQKQDYIPTPNLQKHEILQLYKWLCASTSAQDSNVV